jgi:3-hydroxybutyryl-CoA dehydrogenase
MNIDIRTIGIVGSGTMGNGIAQVAAQAGYNVIMYDVGEEIVAKGYKVIRRNLERDFEKGKKTKEECDLILGRISTSVSLEDLGQVDAIIEAVFERMEVKKEVYEKLDKICKPETYFMSNTSGLSITEMASVTGRSDRFVGMHFFNPVPVMKLVEVIRGYDTTEETFDLAMELAAAMGKDPIAVKEAPLFAVNRILVPMLNEAICVLEEGIASKEDIDKGMRLGANHPIGPFALADMIGLDTVLLVSDTLYRETQDSKYRTPSLLRKMVRAGHLGRKTGEGFYIYK